jgi:hypothetical protein
MKKDIPFPPVENVLIAIAKDDVDSFWKVYILNRNKFDLKDVFIRSKGYGILDGDEQKTSVLRHHFPVLASMEYALIEPIDPGVFHLNNEYWISYFVDGQIFDKKFIFVPDSITDSNLSFIPELNTQGVLHK